MRAVLITAMVAGVLKWYGWLTGNLILLLRAAGIAIYKVFFSAPQKAEPDRKEVAELTHSSFRSDMSDEEIVEADLNELDGPEFNKLVAMYYRDKGYSVQLTNGPGNHEVDLILTDPATKRKIAVQCKHWETENVANDKILRLGAGKRIHNCDDAWCITMGSYSAPAKETAAGLNIRLVNGKNLKELIEQWQKMRMRAS